MFLIYFLENKGKRMRKNKIDLSLILDFVRNYNPPFITDIFFKIYLISKLEKLIGVKIGEERVSFKIGLLKNSQNSKEEKKLIAKVCFDFWNWLKKRDLLFLF